MSEFSVLEFIAVTSFNVSPLAVGNPAPKPKKKAKMKNYFNCCLTVWIDSFRTLFTSSNVVSG
jgi:hypothetical protein